MKLSSIEDIKSKVFPRAYSRIKDALDGDEPLNLLVGAPQGSGKSTWADEMAVSLAKEGKNILIAVPSGDVAKEHRDRISRLGGTCQILQSHKAIFKGNELSCPDYDPIQFLYKLGVGSGAYKAKYCRNCPFLNSCAYPNQYEDAARPDVGIVIIQHAHFQCEETLISLMKNKMFHVLVIDEGFIDSLVDTIKPSEFEVQCLALYSRFGWAKKLHDWLRVGGLSEGRIYPRQEELEEIHTSFEAAGEVWRIKTLVDAYNENTYLHPKTGIKRFAGLPPIPIKVLTDATPTEEEIKIVLDTSELEVVGKNYIVDIKKYNPDNEVIQVLDSSLSKTSLLKDEKLYDLLNFIGNKCFTEFKDQRVLITCFKDKEDFAWSQTALDYLRLKYPSLDIGIDPLVNKIVIDGMKVGVNTFAGFSVQFLLAGVYMSSKQLAESAYRIKLIKNHWRSKYGRKLVQNILPNEVGEVDVEAIPVQRWSPEGLVQYNEYSLIVPINYYHKMAYDKNIGKTQQAIRIRFDQNPTQTKKVFVLGNFNLPSTLITKSILLDDLLL